MESTLVAEMPDSLREDFLAYESALMDDDLAMLDTMFLPGDGTMRADEAGLVVGHDAISAFRSARGGVASRTITRIEPRKLSDGAWVVVSESEFESGRRGIQTQVWVQTTDGWRILTAHVTARVTPREP